MNTTFWVKDDVRLWDLCRLKDKENFTVESLSSGQVHVLNMSDVVPCDLSHLADSHDICLMNSLHEAPLIDLLRRKYEKGSIYSMIGQEDIVLSINPYKSLPGNENFDVYNVNIDRDGGVAISREPHVFATANIALKSLSMTSDDSLKSKNQSIIISGESGAGKTEVAKMIFRFLLHCDASQPEDTSRDGAYERVKRVLTNSTAIFESFGNAKTIRNDNSSRFGKFVKLHYSSDARVMNAVTETFLLERSRLVTQPKGERNYHIFYMLLQSQSGRFGLTFVEDFQILLQGGLSGRIEALSQADSVALEQLMESFTTLSFSTDEVDNIWRLLAVMLHLGNIKLSLPSEGSSVAMEPTLVKFEQISSWLGLEDYLLTRALTTSQVVIANRASINTKILSLADVENNIKGLIKWLYNKLFEWLLFKVNGQYVENSLPGPDPSAFIGVLDIFGFEILEVNSLEQLCINYTNECLQQYFNEKVFIQEQRMYLENGIPWQHISFNDNQCNIDLIAKPGTGLLQQLEELGSLNRKPDDSALLTQFNQSNDKLNNSAYVKSRFKDTFFTVKHFAGDVVYDVSGFVAKNNFSLQDELAELVSLTSDSFLAQVISPPSSRDRSQTRSCDSPSAGMEGGDSSSSGRNRSGKKRSGAVGLSSAFRQQIDSLMSLLRQTEPHYIKCIKPNNDKVPHDFSAFLVADQLRHSGVMEVVRIRREVAAILPLFRIPHHTPQKDPGRHAHTMWYRIL